MPLLWYLRDVLGLTGTKFGCGMALCGACTVHPDGKAIRSCVTTMRAAAGNTEITTIEGISAKGLHPVQQAWIEFNVPQCGYCQSGQIMQAIALLKDKPQPQRSTDIDDAMSGNICRCGTYQRIRAAIKAAAGVSTYEPLTILKTSAGAVFCKGLFSTGALVLSVHLVPEALWAAEPIPRALRMPTAPRCTPASLWASTPTARSIIVAHRSEMGTGSRTSVPLILADELDADWKRVKLEQAIGDCALWRPGH